MKKSKLEGSTQFRSGSPSKSSSAGMNGNRNADSLCPVPHTSRDNSVGPPDLNVVKYLPPSARQVFQLHASEGPLIQKEIISRSYLPSRTVRYALTRLNEENLLVKKFCFPDARQSLYGLNSASSEVITA